MIFSEKDLPGYKPRNIGAPGKVDSDGLPFQGRSNLYDSHKRELRKKENKGRFVPYARRPIPKQTAITGTVTKEYELTAVKNDEYYAIEANRAAEMLKVAEKDTSVFATGDEDPSKKHIPFMSSADKASAMRVRTCVFVLNVFLASANSTNPECTGSPTSSEGNAGGADRQTHPH